MGADRLLREMTRGSKERERRNKPVRDALLSWFFCRQPVLRSAGDPQRHETTNGGSWYT